MSMTKETTNVTVFGQETEFDGVLEFTDNLIITGKFKGTIKATGTLEIDKTAECEVDTMAASSVVVSGKVKGNIEGTERVELCNGSSVSGDIKTSRLRIADNVDFVGQVSMIEGEPSGDIFTLASEEFKSALVLKSTEAR